MKKVSNKKTAPAAKPAAKANPFAKKPGAPAKKGCSPKRCK